MKVPPLNLTPEMNRVGMTYPFNEMLWRYPLSIPQTANSNAAPSSPLLDVKNQMPTHLAPDPRMWSREDVSSFLRWFEREFELPSIEISKFCMNGKALCMLNKTDLADRAPGAGDILHNTLQFLLRDAPQHMLPQSPLTPHHPLMSPTPLTPTPSSQPWNIVKPELHSLGHFLQHGGSVTLSPAPSEQSGGSPRHPDNGPNSGSGFPHSSSASTGSGQSDSEDSIRDDSSSSPQRSPIPPNNLNPAFAVQTLASLKHISDYQRATAAAAMAAAVHSYQDEVQQNYHHTQSHKPQPQTVISQAQTNSPPLLPSQTQGQNTSGTEPEQPAVETGTNGRLLWDFLQQLLNDSQQRYSRYIAWKNRDTGVFKIVDPPGLAKLWGIQKNHLSMNYDKMSRALRYYYRVNILRKVQGERHCYQFLRNPSELKSIKNISMLRGAPLPANRLKEDTSNNTQNSHPTNSSPAAPMEDEEGPTDLSMPAHHQRYNSPLMQPTPHQPSVEYHQSTTPTSMGSTSTMDTEPQNLSVDGHNRLIVKSEEYFE